MANCPECRRKTISRLQTRKSSRHTQALIKDMVSVLEKHCLISNPSSSSSTTSSLSSAEINNSNLLSRPPSTENRSSMCAAITRAWRFSGRLAASMLCVPRRRFAQAYREAEAEVRDLEMDQNLQLHEDMSFGFVLPCCSFFCHLFGIVPDQLPRASGEENEAPLLETELQGSSSDSDCGDDEDDGYNSDDVLGFRVGPIEWRSIFDGIFDRRPT